MMAPRIVQICATDGNFLPHPAREFLRCGVTLLCQLEHIEQCSAFFVQIGYAIGLGDEPEVFPDRERVEQVGIVGDIGQTSFGGDRIGDDIVAVDG